MGGEFSVMTEITAAVTQAVTFMTTAFTAMTKNEYLVVFLGVTMLGVGVTVFRKLRKGA